MKETKRILILINERISQTDKNWTFFRKEVEKSIGPDYEITMGELRSLTFELSRDDSKVYDRERGFSLGDFDLVVFRFVRSDRALASSCASFLRSKKIPYIDRQIRPYPGSKFAAQAMHLGEGIMCIPSVHSNSNELQYMIQNDLIPFGYPLIIKDNNGKKGRLNFIARDKDAALQIFEQNPEVDFIIQEFIENDGDYRFLLMGSHVAVIIHRQAQTDSHLNNTSQGAVAKVVDISNFSAKIISDVIQSAENEKLDVAGVDLMIDRNTGQHYIIEVNSSPQLATGAVPEQKMKAYTDYLASLL